MERHHPGIDSIRMDRDMIRAWQERLWTLSNGKPCKDVHSILVIVRAFYLDIAQWAAEDPGVWAQWVTPCPINDGDLRPFQKIKLHHRARMHARTRSLMPFLPKLIANTHTRLVEATELLTAAEPRHRAQSSRPSGLPTSESRSPSAATRRAPSPRSRPSA